MIMRTAMMENQGGQGRRDQRRKGSTDRGPNTQATAAVIVAGQYDSPNSSELQRDRPEWCPHTRCLWMSPF